jgi:hypothetical protein
MGVCGVPLLLLLRGVRRPCFMGIQRDVGGFRTDVHLQAWHWRWQRTLEACFGSVFLYSPVGITFLCLVPVMAVSDAGYGGPWAHDGCMYALTMGFVFGSAV